MRWLAPLRSALAAGAQQATAWTRRMLFTRSHAQGLVEYGLILVLIMVVCVGILTMVGHTISNVWYTKLISGWPSP
jgi:hypothetical protein